MTKDDYTPSPTTTTGPRSVYGMFIGMLEAATQRMGSAITTLALVKSKEKRGFVRVRIGFVHPQIASY